jgi:pimeloyl-ACP methyl ester carboxylesterase
VPCEIRWISSPTDCGELPVPEDRDAPGSRATIGLAVVRLGATGRASGEDPLFVLFGGPGSSATAAAPWLANTFSTRRERDIVLVDQRGTGRSNPLECDLYGNPANLDSHTGDFIRALPFARFLFRRGRRLDLPNNCASEPQRTLPSGRHAPPWIT